MSQFVHVMVYLTVTIPISIRLKISIWALSIILKDVFKLWSELELRVKPLLVLIFSMRIFYGMRYKNFLENTGPELLEEILLQERRYLIFMHDGAPSHFSRVARAWLNSNYPKSCIGHLGPIIWPRRSPNLTPMDFFLWGTQKTLFIGSGLIPWNS